MANLKFFWAILTTLLTFTACKDEEALPRESCDFGKFQKVTYSEMISPDEFYKSILSAESFDKEILKTLRPAFDPIFRRMMKNQLEELDTDFKSEVGTDGSGQRRWHIEHFEFNYRSKSARGQDVILTGHVTFPNNTVEGVTHELRSLSLVSRGAKDLTTTSTHSLSASEMHTLFNSAIIIPEFQGGGVNTGKDVYCAISSKVLAQQMADCTLAALELMKRRGVVLAEDGFTNTFGISLGATVSLAFAKYYETQAPEWFRNTIRLKSTIASNGPLDFAGTFWYMSEHPEFNATLTKSLAVSLAALDKSQLGGYDPKSFMADVFHNTMVEVNGQQRTYYDALLYDSYNVLGTEKSVPKAYNLSDVLAADMLTATGKLNSNSPKLQTFMRVITEQNDIFGWSPTLPVYIIHCPDDNAIPYEQARNYYNILSSNGSNTNVHWGDVEFPSLLKAALSRMDGGIHAASAIYSTWKWAVVEDPKEFVDGLTD